MMRNRVFPVVKVPHVSVAPMLAALLLAGCSSFGAKKQEAPVDPNTYPATYRTQLVNFLRQSLANRADFRGAMVAPPMLRQVGDAQRYIVCVQFNAASKIPPKVAIYFADRISQFVDSTPEQCGNAPYQPFTELQAAVPAM